MRSTALGIGVAAACGLAIALFSPAVSGYEVVPVTDGGTIEGRVTYTGTIPTKRIVPTSDREVCGSVREWQMVERGADGGIRNAVVHLAEIDRGKAWADGQEMKTPVIDNVKCMFDPHVQVIRPGEVTVHNSDPVLHNTKAYYGRRAVFNIALPHQDTHIKQELTRPGVVRIECDAHGWMEAWAYVLEHPYFAITGEDGTFRITDVSPGEYTLVVRQEYVGDMEHKVKVGASETVTLSLELKK